MTKFLMRALGAGAVTFTAAHMVYGNSPYASAAGFQIPTEILEKVLPVLVAIFYPFITQRWPWLAQILGLIKLPTATGELDLLNQLELKCVNCPESLTHLTSLRKGALEKYREETAPTPTSK